jgi:hypothetical protein
MIDDANDDFILDWDCGVGVAMKQACHSFIILHVNGIFYIYFFKKNIPVYNIYFLIR